MSYDIRKGSLLVSGRNSCTHALPMSRREMVHVLKQAYEQLRLPQDSKSGILCVELEDDKVGHLPCETWAFPGHRIWK